LEQAIAKNIESEKKKDIRSKTRTKFSVKEKTSEIWKPDGDIAKEYQLQVNPDTAVQESEKLKETAQKSF
jgi:hypothetical protein